MADTMARLMVSIPAEVKKEIDVVKQKEFYDKPYAELYRKIIRLGLDKMKEAKAREKQCEMASENILSAAGGENPLIKPTI